jgi:hypothetical protein
MVHDHSQHPSGPSSLTAAEKLEALCSLIRFLIKQELALAAASEWEPLFGERNDAPVRSHTINRPVCVEGDSAS